MDTPVFLRHIPLRGVISVACVQTGAKAPLWFALRPQETLYHPAYMLRNVSSRVWRRSMAGGGSPRLSKTASLIAFISSPVHALVGSGLPNRRYLFPAWRP